MRKRTWHVALLALGMSMFTLGADTKNDPGAGLPEPGADGFITLFDGKSLDGWQGLEGFWSVEDGAIVGKETKDRSKQTDILLAASREHPEKFTNFELHLKYQLVTPEGNSGIQFRGKIDNPETLHVGGYQADIDDKGGYVGSIYDENGQAGHRNTMSNRGEKTHWTSENKREATPLAESADELKKHVHLIGGWNDIVLTVNGNHVVYSINGHLMTEMTDESPKAVLNGGIIAFQMHQGFTMEIRFKDIKLKFLDGKN